MQKTPNVSGLESSPEHRHVLMAEVKHLETATQFNNLENSFFVPKWTLVKLLG